MAESITIECTFHVKAGRSGHGRMENGSGSERAKVEPGRVPRVSRLMALAIRFERLIQEGHVRDYAQLSRLGHVTRARVTQIMNLRLLAPEIQEDILFLPRVHEGRDPITERDLRPLVAELEWADQRRMWRSLKAIYETD